MNKLVVKGIHNFNGKDVKIIEGGFSKSCRIVTDKQISELHNMENSEIRKSIKRLVEKYRIKEDVDYIDLKVSKEFTNNFETLGYTKMQISKSESIFILSERGYIKLIKSMDDDSSWDIMDKFVDEYFTMREIIRENKLKVPQTYAEALLEAGRLALENEKLLLENKVKNDKIEKDKPLVEFAEQIAGSVDTLDMGDFAKMLYDERINVGRNKLFDWLKMKKIFTEYSKPMQSYIVNGWFELTEVTKVTPYGPKIYPKVLIKGLGQVKITEMLRSGYDEEELKAYKKSKGNIILDL